MSNIRNVTNIGETTYVAIPKDFGFKKGESVIVEQIDNNTCRITKVEYIKKT